MATTADAEQRRTVADGWEALARGDWSAARAVFERAVTTGAGDGPDRSLVAESSEGLAWAAMWLLDTDTLFAARLTAYRAYRSVHDDVGAARVAMWIGSDHEDYRGETAAARGWLRRARRLLDGKPPSAEHAWLAVLEADLLIGYHEDPGEARRLGGVATRIGRAVDDPELELIGLAVEGRALVVQGDVGAGMTLLDEAAAVAQAEQVAHSLALSWSFCYLLSVCEMVDDYERAAAWCRRAEEIAEQQGLPFIWGLCRTKHAAVLVMRGDWAEAEDELDSAAESLRRSRPHWIGAATLRLGELRRRQGRLAEARELFRRTEQDPMALVGLGRIALDGGAAGRARELAEQALRGLAPASRLERSRPWLLLAEASAAEGDLTGARAAVAELDASAVTTRSGFLRAGAEYAAAVVAVAAGDLDDARRRFEDAVTTAERAHLPYEAARARLGLAEVLGRTGRSAESVQIAARARDDLHRLGADVESLRARALMAGPATAQGAATAQRPATAQPEVSGPDVGAVRLTPREREVLGLVARGLGDREIAAELVLSEHTVHRHVANVLARLDCPTRAAAVARATAAGLLTPRA
ncbi:LuxR C-terminal-related transcriptional regulator [Isoptericola rhizosphaerae]|uniref:LuxR C-terminal-related transcriptional regulator n=1 Tax=Isoptericola rhizosphaerae TaxID=3377837 RepID=UPI00383B5FDD